MKRAFLPIAEYLQRVQVFRDLSREEIALLFGGVQTLECPSGTVLFAPEETGERLFILKVGRVDVYRLTSSGRRLVVQRLNPGAIFGEMGLLGQSLQGCFAEASEQSFLCIVTKERLVEVLRQHPEVALRMLEIVGNRLSQIEERLEQALFSPVRVRLANFLLSNLDTAKGIVADYTHEDIGDTIGALRQTVTETLCQMRDQGLVEVERKRIRITNRVRLVEIARGGDVVLPERAK